MDDGCDGEYDEELDVDAMRRSCDCAIEEEDAMRSWMMELDGEL